MTDRAGSTRRTEYDLRGAPKSQTDALGRTTRFEVDAAGNLTQSTDALNRSTTYAYDARGRRTQTASPSGRTQTVRYDLKGRVIELLAPGETQGQGSRVQYDSNGWPIRSITPGGAVTTTNYDNDGQVSSTQDPAGNITAYDYGVNGSAQTGLLIATRYPTFKETYQYDALGRQTVVRQYLDDEHARAQVQAYDALGQRTASTDPLGRTTLYQYDVLGRLTQTIDPLSQTTKQTWDAQDNLTGITDAKGNTYAFEYDKTGRVTKETRPLGGTIQYSYDAVGQLTQRTDAAGNTRNYSYDAAGRLVTEEHRLGGTTLDQRISYSHDQDGQLTGYEQRDGNNNLLSSAAYTFDAQGRTLQSVTTYGKVDGGSFSFTIGQSFTADGQLQSHTYPDGSKQNYSYSAGRLTKITLPNNSEINYGNYAWQMPGQISTPGAVKSLGYDALQRPTTIEVKNAAAQTLAKRLYQYDLASNITQIDSDLGQTAYGYDQLDRLTQATPDNALQQLGLPSELYTYDAVGNRIASGHQQGVWSYNNDNQLTRYPRLTPFNLGANPVDTQVSYTPQGHTQKESNVQGAWSYGYNAAERLINYASTAQGQADPNLKVEYRYDPAGRRIAKSVTEGGSTKTTYFIYSHQGLMAEADQSGRLTKVYGFNPQATERGLWSTEPLWQAELANGSLTDTATNYDYIHTDHLSTPILATDKTGATHWKAVTEAFGAAGTLSETRITMNLRFPGQYYDQESGAHYNLFRDYKPATGRYLQSDPLGLKGGPNLFEYAKQNPLIVTDDKGRIPIPIKFTQPDKPIGDGCGDEKSDKYVPDAYQGFDFSAPCWNHDQCYGTCGNPKNTCDYKFLLDMRTVCSQMGLISKLIYGGDCYLLANVYYVAVATMGRSAYCEAQKKRCPECVRIPGC
jgi:RHS repeat-associated protein